MERTWRDAKIPKWVSDDIEREMSAMKLTNALSWPTESKPKPAPFQWGDYDKLTGEPEEGVFWKVSHDGFVECVKIRRRTEADKMTYKAWVFDYGQGYVASIPRGKLFYSEKDARLFGLWSVCERFAKKLMSLRSKVYE